MVMAPHKREPDNLSSWRILLRYIVSSHSFLVVIDFDSEWNIKNDFLLSKGSHYGIALLNENSLSEKPSHFIVYRGGDSNQHQDANELLKYENTDKVNFIEKIRLAEGFGDVHQLAYANGGIYLSNTKYNSLVFQGDHNQVCHEYLFNHVSYDLNHLNSIYPCGNQLLVMLHNRGKKESELGILEHNLAMGLSLKKVLSLWNFSSHNVFVDGKYLFYNGSNVGEFVVVDLKEEQIVKKITLAGHTKGMSVTKDFVVIGLSEHTFRDKRDTSRGQLAVIDRHSLSLISMVDLNLSSLPHPVGNINEVRCLSGGELAHSSPQRLTLNWSALNLAKRQPIYDKLYWMDSELIPSIRPIKKTVVQPKTRQTATPSASTVPKTGQTTSYATGDDGDLEMGVAWPSPRFTDNSDGTVTDNLTGLIWLKNANGPNTKREWNTALSDVTELNTNGTMNDHHCGDSSNAGSHQTDWRLPNVRELLSLVDYGQDKPALPSGHPFSDVHSDFYWSSSTHAHHTTNAWYARLLRGFVNDDNKTNAYYVWPVRGGDLEMGIAWPSPRFTDNSDGTVTDNLTGLIWLKNANGPNTKREWNTALSDVTELNTNGTMNDHHCGDSSNAGSHQTDWRLPNVRELLSLVDYGQDKPALPSGHPFSGVHSDYYWSSSTYTEVTTDGWGVNLEYGNVNDGNKMNMCYVWPVRGGQ